MTDQLRRGVNGGDKRNGKGNGRPDHVNMALQALESYAHIREPKDAEEPILAPTVQANIYEWLIELEHKELLADVKVEPRRLCLMYGPPGTGKTTLAHHVAARLGLPLVAVASEKIIDKYLGASSRNIGQLFDLLKPVEKDCVVLFDEFDALATKRTGDSGGGAQNERNQVLTVILRRIEEFKGIGFAATNTKDMIDAAAWRRFGLMVPIDLPGAEERFAIIRKYARPFDLEDDDIDKLVELTTRCSPSLLRQLMEGMKRTIVLAPKLNRDVSCPVRVFSQVVRAIAPPPELDQPPLWHNSDAAVEKLHGMQWPPKFIEG
jgi:SpoVK/Ycf46/Vps4 family AAA+-type ATPase